MAKVSARVSLEEGGGLRRRGARVAAVTAAIFVAAAGLLAILINVACASGGLECVVWFVPVGILLAAGAPTAAIFVPPFIEAAPWFGLLMGVATSLPGWWWIGGALARRALRRRPESAWRAWQNYFAGTLAASAAVSTAVYLIFTALLPQPPG